MGLFLQKVLFCFAKIPTEFETPTDKFYQSGFAIMGIENYISMSHPFPDKLISRCQKVISQYAGIEISEDEAVLYLEKFARLMRVTIKIMKQVEAKKSKN